MSTLNYVRWTPAQMRWEAIDTAMVVGGSAGALVLVGEELAVAYGIKIEAIAFVAVVAIAFTLPALASYVFMRRSQATAIANYDPARDPANMRIGFDKQQSHH